VQSVRWLLILPVAVVAWLVALLMAAGLDANAESLCTSGLEISDQCISIAKASVVPFGAGLAALLIVIGCTWVAPTHKRQVAIATFSVGAVVAAVIGVSAGDRFILVPMVAAIVVGAGALALLLRRHPPFPPPNNSLERTREG
jgi:hypothetical protein